MIALLYVLGFAVGEKLNYIGKFSFLNLGTMTLEIQDTLTFSGYPCYHLSSTVMSNPGLQLLFSLNDTIDVYTRTHDFLPLLYEERIHEGSYYNHTRLSFDHDNLRVRYDDTLSYVLAEQSRDLVSFWYFLRTIALHVGDTVRVNIHKSKENYEILCPVRTVEKVVTPLGEFMAILVSPQTEGKGIFGVGGSMDIWYSADEMRYPVQIRAKMKVGSVLFKLREVRY
jgi:hypothetical protein